MMPFHLVSIGLSLAEMKSSLKSEPFDGILVCQLKKCKLGGVRGHIHQQWMVGLVRGWMLPVHSTE